RNWNLVIRTRTAIGCAMKVFSTSRVARRLAVLDSGAFLALASPAAANVQLSRVSSDPFTNTTSQHATEVEPGTSNRSTVVSAFQVGRFRVKCSSNDIVFSTSSTERRG